MKCSLTKCVVGIAVLLSLVGCGSKSVNTQNEQTSGKEEEIQNEEMQTVENIESQSLMWTESAHDMQVDIKALQEENPDVFGWIYVPGTNIDYPILQSAISDDYYENHNMLAELSDEGALYIEMANLVDMCDFNTVIHGKSDSNGTNGLFAELYQYTEESYLNENNTVYVFLDGNTLTYQIFAAFERDNTSLIRTYDFTYINGCQDYLDDIFTKKIGKNVVEGWKEVLSPYNFLITLSTSLGNSAEKQYVVVAALINDPMGTIDRPYME